MKSLSNSQLKNGDGRWYGSFTFYSRKKITGTTIIEGYGLSET